MSDPDEGARQAQREARRNWRLAWAWSLFGMQRIISWEAPLMGWRFVFVRVVPSLAFPVVAGLLVNFFYSE